MERLQSSFTEPGFARFIHFNLFQIAFFIRQNVPIDLVANTGVFKEPIGSVKGARTVSAGDHKQPPVRLPVAPDQIFLRL
ncbi:MAG: hypothetical protein BWY83_01827 [bacterium ADurb.Bin478]|nr:MAG: hypothetical protein BWY83_01827 [bacterium ADurb.Bin478]